jgi:hypothetical protein
MRSLCVGAVVIAVGLAGCGAEEPDQQAARAVSGGKADAPSSCQDSCGGQADAGCWCDDACALYGDCCADKQEACDVAAPGGPGPCHGVCTYGASCTDYCPPRASCVKVVDTAPGHWKVLGCGVW